MKCQILFPQKSKKKYFGMSSAANFTQSVKCLMSLLLSGDVCELLFEQRAVQTQNKTCFHNLILTANIRTGIPCQSSQYILMSL